MTKWPMVLFLVLLACGTKEIKSPPTNLAIGTYTQKEGHVDGKAEGVYLAHVDFNTGLVQVVDTIHNLINPSYLTIANSYLYTVNELADKSEPGIGELTAIKLDNHKERQAIKINGNAPCHVFYAEAHERLIVSSYMGVVSLVEAAPKLKLLDALKPMGEVSHPHMAMYAPDGKTILVCDLGLDKVLHLKIENNALVEIARTPITPGGGPRHLAISSTGIVYVLNELNHHVEVFIWLGADRAMQAQQEISTLAEGIEDSLVSCSAIKLHPNGKFLYTANRGLGNSKEQSISLFRVGEEGKITLIEKFATRGEIPRDFEITPDGNYLLAANQNTDNVISFKINAKTGALVYCGNELKVNTPVCLKFF